MIKKLKNVNGFTLAEILITLFIIGIIVAVTIPIIINKVNESAYKESARKAYSTIYQAVNQYKEDENPDLSVVYAGNFNTKFRQEMRPYFSVIDDCGMNCVGYHVTSQVYKTLTGLPASDIRTNGGGFVTKDGMTILFDDVYLLFAVDVNSHKKGPNIYGIDFFVFELMKSDFTLKPLGAPGTMVLICDRVSGSGMNGFGCAAKVMMNQDY